VPVLAITPIKLPEIGAFKAHSRYWLVSEQHAAGYLPRIVQPGKYDTMRVLNPDSSAIGNNLS